MRHTATFALIILMMASGSARAQAQAPGAFPPCVPTGQPALGAPAAPAPAGVPPAGAPAGGGAAARTPRDLTIVGIPGVVNAGSTWTKVWQAGGNSADGILPDKDGNMLVAQEDFDSVLRLDARGGTSVAVTAAKGVGSLSMDRQGRLYGAHRTERPGSTKPDRDQIVNAITMLAPERRTIADKWADGTPLSVRPNDLAADSQGGAYFTSGCVYYASPAGTVSVVAENLRTNGILFSLDDKTLFVTNGGGVGVKPTLVAFDVVGPGRLAGRRDFATLDAGTGDGLALDADGRIYVTSNPGVQVFDKTGKYLGLIPTPRAVISVGFGGRDKQTLWVVGSGADDENNQPILQGPQQTAATVYSLPMVAKGIPGRSK